MFINPCDENYSGQNLQIICEFLAITRPLVTYFSGSKSGPSNFVVPYLCQLFGTSAGLFFFYWKCKQLVLDLALVLDWWKKRLQEEIKVERT